MALELPTLALDEPTALEATSTIVAEVREGRGDVRALGGIAIALRCASARRPGPFARTYSDIDLIASSASARAVAAAMEKLGYEPQERFNALHGHARLLFDRADGVHVDVFVGEFTMCHRLDLAPRLAIHDTTLSLADLLLTKLQVARLNAKDVADALALFVDHDVTESETGINARYVAELLARDWGWWRTVTENLQALEQYVEGSAEPDEAARVRDRLRALRETVDAQSKSMRWKIRAKAGERIPWRNDPEDE